MNRYFASAPGQRRVRRASDVWLAVLSALLVVWTALNAGHSADAEAAMTDLAQSVPAWFDQVYRIAYFLGLVLVWGIVVMILAQGKKRLDVLRDIAISIAMMIAFVMVITWWLDAASAPVFPDFIGAESENTFPVLRVAMMASVIAVAAPHLARPVRRLAWLMIVLVAISSFGLEFGLPGDALGGIAFGLLSGAIVLLIFGSPTGYPESAAVVSALGDLGLKIDGLTLDSDRSWGVRRFTGGLEDGTAIEVKAYGRDAMNSQRFARAWHAMWYRDDGQMHISSRLGAVEHEALSLLTAQRSGVTTPDMLTVGIGGDDMALLATTRRGTALDFHDMDGELLAAAWAEVRQLHDDAGVSHGTLTLNAISVDERRPVISDFTSASLAATDAQKSLDVVSLVYSTALVVGAQEAVAAARAGVGDQALIDSVPFLQVPALTHAQRRLADSPKSVVAEVRDEVAAVTAIELPEPAKLRRIRPKDLIMPALSLVAAYALLGMLTDIDFAAVWDVVQNATWTWIIVGFFVGQTVFVPEATGMLFATGYALPLRPLTVLQVSVKWIGLAVPSAAGRIAMNSLFLRKYGVSPTLAVTQGALDGLAGFATEAIILLVALIASDLSLDINTEDINLALILLIVVVLIVGTTIAVLRISRLRKAVLPPLRDAWDLLRGLLKDPRRTLGLFGSNLGSRVILAVTLWFILQAIGTPLPLAVALVATVATNLLAGLVPIPGGIGVAEAVMTSLLIVAGLGADEAFAAAVVFRLATFYVPAGEGFFAMRWLEQNGYL